MKKVIKTKDAKKGGYLVGKPHSEGGIKGINTDTGEPIEVEGGEVVITKPAVDSSKRYNFEGKEMTPKEILSKLNSDHGGVAFAKGGVVDGDKFSQGGLMKTYSVDEITALYKTRTAVDIPIIEMIGDDINLTPMKGFNNISIPVGSSYLYINHKVAGTNSSETNPFYRYVFVGDYFILQGDFYQNIDKYEASEATYTWQKMKDRILNNFDLITPWQIVYINLNSQDEVGYLWLERIVNGESQRLRIPQSEMNTDRYLVVSNFCGKIEVPRAFGDYYLPQDNESGLSDNWMAGKPVLSFDKNADYQSNIGSLFYQYKHLENTFFRNFHGRVKKLITDRSEYLKHPSVLHLLNSTTTGGSIQDIFAIEGDVVDLQLDLRTYETYAERIDSLDTIHDRIKTGKYTFRKTGKYANEVNLRDLAPNGFLNNAKIIGLQSLWYDDNGFIGNSNLLGIYVEINGVYYDINAELIKKIVRFHSLAEGPVGSNATAPTELEKSIRQVRSKPQTNKLLYQKLLQITDAEISKYSVLRGIVDAGNIPRRNEIDRKLAQLQDDRDTFALKVDTGLELLDKFAALETQEKEDTAGGVTSNPAINGQPSELTDRQWHKVRTQNFMAWFGNWEKAYETSNYGNVSKAINERTGEPIVLYHGSRADFARWRFNQFPAAYFADNRSYSQWFANLYGEGALYQVFLNIKNPIDMRIFGAEQRPLREYLEYMKDNYKIDYEDAYPKIKQYQAGGQEAVDGLLDTPLRFWEFIRHWNADFLTYLRDKTFYDGIIMYENNPSDQINGQDNVTASYVVFRNDQIRWASANHFIGKVNDARFALGGKIEQRSQRDLLKNMDFVI